MTKKPACYAIIEIDRELGSMTILARTPSGGCDFTKSNPFAAWIVDAEVAEMLVKEYSDLRAKWGQAERYCVSKLKVI